MNKIFISLLSGFSGGVLIRSFFNFNWSFALFFIFIGLILVALFKFFKFSKFILFISLFFISLGLGIFRYEMRNSENYIFEEQIGSKINITGTIVEEPDERENYTRLIVEENKNKVKILIYSKRYPIFNYGDVLELGGILNRPEIFDIKDGEKIFDWPAYLAKDDIYFEMFYPQIDLVKKGGGGFWLDRWLLNIKQKYIENISGIVPEPNASFLSGVTIGGKQVMPKDLLEKFQKTGVIHIVVLSGYNVTIVADTLMKILSFLPQLFSIGVGVLGILFFVLMTGASATVVRASIMAAIVLLAKATGRVYQITIALFVAGFLMILHNPKILRFDASFQLSFLATLALIYFAPLIERKLKFITDKFQLRGIISSTISTQIFVLPFLLYKMGIFSVVSLPVNILILSFIPLTMFFGFFAGSVGFTSTLLSTSISQFLSIPFGWIAYAFSAYELWIVDIFSKIPFASFDFSIPFWLMLTIYFFYAILFLKIKE